MMVNFKYKMRVYPLLLACGFICGAAMFFLPQSSALAQPLEKPSEPTLEERLGLVKPQPERRMTGDPVKDTALRYYNACMQSEEPLFASEIHQLFCACVSDTMPSTMSAEEITSLFDNTPQGTKSRQTLFTKVHGQCARHPVHVFILDNCLSNDSLRQSLPNHRAVCECNADTIADYISEYPQNLLSQQLTITPETNMPLQEYLMGREFTGINGAVMERCVQIHVFGYK